MVAKNTRVGLLYFYYVSRTKWTFPLHVDAVTNSLNVWWICRNRNEPVFSSASLIRTCKT